MPLSSHSHEPPSWLKRKVSGWFWSLTPSCHEVARLTSEGRDHALPFATRARLGLHRAFCQWCARYAKQLDLLGEASQRFPEYLAQTKTPALRDEAKARMKRAISR